MKKVLKEELKIRRFIWMKNILYFLQKVNNFEDNSILICKLWKKLEVSIVVVNNRKYTIWSISDEEK